MLFGGAVVLNNPTSSEETAAQGATTLRQTSLIGQELRQQIQTFMASIPIPERTPSGEPPAVNTAGVAEFYKHWQVRGESPTTGLFATYSDNDDIIEFGLSERRDDTLRNVLQVSLGLTAEGGELNLLSETQTDLNLDAEITPDNAQPLQRALRYFGQVIRGD
jgi:hypothetical protein